MTSNEKVSTPSEIHKHATVSFFKNMVANRYANHVLSIFNRMPQHCNHNMYCYKTFQYKRYTKYK